MRWRVILSHLGSHVGGALTGGMIQIMAMTALAGLYGPVAFSALAIFMSLGNTLAIFTTGNLSGYTISLSQLQNRLNFAATLITNTVFFGVISGFVFPILTLLDVMSILPQGSWMVPAFVVFQSFSSVLYSLHLSAERTRRAASSLVLRPALFLLFGVGSWYLKFMDIGLLAAVTLSEFGVFVFLMYGVIAVERKRLFGVSFSRWRANWRRQWRIYLTGGLGAYLSSVAAGAPILVGGWVMNPVQLGNLAMTQRLMSAPIAMIGSPLSAIVNRALARRFHDGQTIFPHVVMAYFGGLIAGAVGFGVLTAIVTFAKDSLPPDWFGVATLAPIVFTAGSFVFATSMIGFLPILIGNIRFLVTWSSCRIIGIVLGALAVNYFEYSYVYFLIIFAAVEACGSLIFFLMNIIKIGYRIRD